jgi:hypothetical protein
MRRDFNLPPGCTIDDVDPPERDEVDIESDKADMERDHNIDDQIDVFAVVREWYQQKPGYHLCKQCEQVWTDKEICVDCSDSESHGWPPTKTL